MFYKLIFYFAILFMIIFVISHYLFGVNIIHKIYNFKNKTVENYLLNDSNTVRISNPIWSETVSIYIDDLLKVYNEEKNNDKFIKITDEMVASINNTTNKNDNWDVSVAEEKYLTRENMVGYHISLKPNTKKDTIEFQDDTINFNKKIEVSKNLKIIKSVGKFWINSTFPVLHIYFEKNKLNFNPLKIYDIL